MNILAMNCGSSSLKYTTFANDDAVLRGTIDRVGTRGVADYAAAVRACSTRSAPIGSTRWDIAGPRRPEQLRARTRRRPHCSSHSSIPFAPLHLRIELGAIAAVRAHLLRHRISPNASGGRAAIRAAAVRFEIWRDLEHLGIELDDTRNRAGAAVISRAACDGCVVVTDEERMIVRHTRRLVDRDDSSREPAL